MIDFRYQCLSFDEEYRLGCFTKTEVTALGADCLLVAEQGARSVNPTLVGLRIRLEETVGLSTLQKVMGVVPAIIPSFFVRTNILAMVLLFVLAWPAAAFRDHVLGSIPQYPNPEWLRGASTQIFLDPIVLHGISMMFGCWLLFSIARQKGLSRFPALLVSIGILAYVLILSFLISDEVLKPAFAYPRSIAYNPDSEPPITGLIRNWTGVGTAVPSGFMLRQVTLCLAFFWIAGHPQAPIRFSGSIRKWFIYSLNVLLVILVAFLRMYNNAHEPFDVVIGAGIGILVFWLSVVPLSALLYERPKSLLPELATFWMIFLVGLAFYSQNASRWIITSASIISILGFLSLLPRINVRKLSLRSGL